MRKPDKKFENIILMILFLIFLFLRLFSDSNYFVMQSRDDTRYLTLANNFPYQTIYNHQFFIMHPPLYPYIVHFFSLVIEDYKAGIIVSLISAALTFFILYDLIKIVTKNYIIALFSTILYSISQIFITHSTRALKESFAVMIALASIYFYIKYLKHGKVKELIYSSVFGSLMALTTDHVVLLIPALASCYILFGKKVILLKSSTPLLLTVITYSFWMLTRLYIYTHYNYYPAGIDGVVVDTSKWGFNQLLSSHYFVETSQIIPSGFSFQISNYLYPVLYMLNTEIAPWPSQLQLKNVPILFSFKYFPQLVIYSFLSIAAIWGFYRIIKSLVKIRIRENSMLLFTILFLIFAIPLTQKLVYPKYTITAIVFLYVIISFGLYEIIKKSYAVVKGFTLLVIIILILYLPFYLHSNPYFVLSKEKIVEASKTADYLKQLPNDGIMAQIGYTEELIYLTGKRILALPINSSYIFLIDQYNISYLVYGELNVKPYSESNKDDVHNYDTIKYIKEHSNRFKLLNVVEETYPHSDKKDNLYIYKVSQKG